MWQVCVRGCLCGRVASEYGASCCALDASTHTRGSDETWASTRCCLAEQGCYENMCVGTSLLTSTQKDALSHRPFVLVQHISFVLACLLEHVSCAERLQSVVCVHVCTSVIVSARMFGSGCALVVMIMKLRKGAESSS